MFSRFRHHDCLLMEAKVCLDHQPAFSWTELRQF
jgi:hypothetical protein